MSKNKIHRPSVQNRSFQLIIAYSFFRFENCLEEAVAKLKNRNKRKWRKRRLVDVKKSNTSTKHTKSTVSIESLSNDV